ncbi:DUF188 domain-containing protein [Melghiribacillus thermohalophilus]|uniref:DUF188 domain-containing protein n=1 Tax=Melghiribacillus thermohalophilus TaxID=1324956 RepID=UPI00104CC969|nr:DUF188 domain-containing protein [Melghiribacillus thermohalophilus]
MTNIFVDADQCPVKKEICMFTQKYSFTPFFVTTYQNNPAHVECGKWCLVDQGIESVDYFILNQVKPGDLVVTDDLSLATLLTIRRVQVLTSRGRLISEKDAEHILLRKHLRMKNQRKNVRVKGPSPFTGRDREIFCSVFEKILSTNEGFFSSF